MAKFNISILIFLFSINLNTMIIAKLHNSLYGTWCDPQLCHNSGARHIACHNSGNFGPDCPQDAVMVNVESFKEKFVHEHNRWRNEISMGRIPGYKPAAKMATMVWDDQLAYLASLNAKTCVFEHDKCYNTYEYRNAGQSLAGLWTARDRPMNLTKLIEEAVYGWFEEYSLIDMSYIDNFRVAHNFEEYGHFTEFVVDKNARVGCAVIRFTQADEPFWYRINISCDYSSIHSSEGPIYQSGKPASKCATGRNHKYPGLCSTREYFNPNVYDYELYYNKK